MFSLFLLQRLHISRIVSCLEEASKTENPVFSLELAKIFLQLLNRQYLTLIGYLQYSIQYTLYAIH